MLYQVYVCKNGYIIVIKIDETNESRYKIGYLKPRGLTSWLNRFSSLNAQAPQSQTDFSLYSTAIRCNENDMKYIVDRLKANQNYFMEFDYYKEFAEVDLDRFKVRCLIGDE